MLMENKLEQLLNSLIEKGWKPFGRETRHELSSGVVYDTIDIKGKGDIRVIDRWHHHIRELVAKESGLWQFVCENNLVPIMCDEEWIKHYYKDIDDDNLISGENIQPTTEYEYRLIESALCDEDKLEEFLLSNIVIKDE